MTRDVSALSHAVPSEGPLAGIRVIETGQLLAGPFCGQLLGDLGAEVIKIEPPAGDPMRLWGREKPHGQSLWWPVVARNKRSVVLDLRTAEGQEGHFFELSEAARAKERRGVPLTPLDFKFHFFPWWKSPDYELDPASVEITDANDR